MWTWPKCGCDWTTDFSHKRPHGNHAPFLLSQLTPHVIHAARICKKGPISIFLPCIHWEHPTSFTSLPFTYSTPCQTCPSHSQRAPYVCKVPPIHRQHSMWAISYLFIDRTPSELCHSIHEEKHMSDMFTDSQRAPYVRHIHPFTNSSSCQPSLLHSHIALQVTHVPPIQKEFPMSMSLHSQIGPSVSHPPLYSQTVPLCQPCLSHSKKEPPVSHTSLHSKTFWEGPVVHLISIVGCN